MHVVFRGFLSAKLFLWRGLWVQKRLRYSCQPTIELIRWIMQSPPWFCLPLFSLPLRPEAQGFLETCHVTFGCRRSVRRSKGKERGCTFHGNAEKRRKPAAHPTPPRLLQRGFGGCQRVRERSWGGGDGHVWALVPSEIQTAEVPHEQKDFPLDERVETLGSESWQEDHRSVRPFHCLRLENELLFSLSGSKGQRVINQTTVSEDARG